MKVTELNLSRPQIQSLIDILKGRDATVAQRQSLLALQRRGLVYLMPPIFDGTGKRYWNLTEKGREHVRRYHVHSSECTDDPTYPLGGLKIICGIREGDLVRETEVPA
jgi:hypothetical protein